MKICKVFFIFGVLAVFASKSMACHTEIDVALDKHSHNSPMGISATIEQTQAVALTTSDCTAYTNFLKDEFDNLEESIAVGQGAHLDALAVYMGCQPQVQNDFNKALQKNFITLFSDGTSSRISLFSHRIQEIMKRDTILKKSCTGLPATV